MLGRDDIFSVFQNHLQRKKKAKKYIIIIIIIIVYLLIVKMYPQEDELSCIIYTTFLILAWSAIFIHVSKSICPFLSLPFWWEFLISLWSSGLLLFILSVPPKIFILLELIFESHSLFISHVIWDIQCMFIKPKSTFLSGKNNFILPLCLIIFCWWY